MSCRAHPHETCGAAACADLAAEMVPSGTRSVQPAGFFPSLTDRGMLRLAGQGILAKPIVLAWVLQEV